MSFLEKLSVASSEQNTVLTPNQTPHWEVDLSRAARQIQGSGSASDSITIKCNAGVDNDWTRRVSGGNAPQILKSGTQWRRVVSFRLGRFVSGRHWMQDWMDLKSLSGRSDDKKRRCPAAKNRSSFQILHLLHPF